MALVAFGEFFRGRSQLQTDFCLVLMFVLLLNWNHEPTAVNIWMKRHILMNFLNEWLQLFILKNSRTFVIWKASCLAGNSLQKNSRRFGQFTSLQINIRFSTVQNDQFGNWILLRFHFHGTFSVLPCLLHATFIMTETSV